MATVRMPVNKEVLKWAVEQSGKDLDEAKSKFAIDQWLEDERNPTFNQVKHLSAYLQIPFGYFLLSKPPEEDLTLMNYRTIIKERIVVGTKKQNIFSVLFFLAQLQFFLLNNSRTVTFQSS